MEFFFKLSQVVDRNSIKTVDKQKHCYVDDAVIYPATVLFMAEDVEGLKIGQGNETLIFLMHEVAKELQHVLLTLICCI